MEAHHHPGHHVDSQRDPRTPSSLTGSLVYNHHIDLRVVDLHDLKWPTDLRYTPGVAIRARTKPVSPLRKERMRSSIRNNRALTVRQVGAESSAAGVLRPIKPSNFAEAAGELASGPLAQGIL